MVKRLKFSFIGLILLSFAVFVGIGGSSFAFALDVADLDNNDINQPYSIATQQDLDDFVTMVNDGNSFYNKYFVLDSSGLTLTSAIGGADSTFNGVFNGNGYAINLDIDSESDYVGAFGNIGSNGVVKNLITTGSVAGGSYLGGIAGKNAGEIINCINEASVTAKSEFSRYVGGIVGSNENKVVDSINSGDVYANKYVAGVVGQNKSSIGQGYGIEGVVNVGSVAKLNGNAVVENMAGIVGYTQLMVRDSYNFSVINESGAGALIGMFADNYQGKSTFVYNIGSENTKLISSSLISTIPNTFRNISFFDFVNRTSVEFSSGAMVDFDSEQAYAFMPIPQGISDSDRAKENLKVSIFDSGSGSLSAPFVIKTQEQFSLFVDNSQLFDYLGVYVQLGADLSLDLSPIAQGLESGFLGHLDGNQRTLTLDYSGEDNVGLFEKLGENSSVCDLTISGNITASSDYVGGLTATAYKSNINNIEVLASVTGVQYVGGLVGFDERSSFGDIEVNNSVVGVKYLGGVVGYSDNSVITSEIINSASITVDDKVQGENIGGIIGYQKSSDLQISLLYNFGKVTAKKSLYVGGLIGQVESSGGSGIGISANNGNIEANSSVGGLIGKISGDYIVADIYVLGNVVGANNVGGFVGSIGSGDSVIFEDGYAVVKLYKQENTAIDTDTFSVVSNGGLVTSNDVFYDENVYRGIDTDKVNLIVNNADNATNVNQITLSNKRFNDSWAETNNTINTGFYPMLLGFNKATNYMKDYARISYFVDGVGSIDEPLTIENEQQFKNFAYLVNSENAEFGDLFYKLVADIDFDFDYDVVGTSSATAFRGSFDGAEHKLNDIVIEQATTDYLGVFGYTDGSRIFDIIIESGTIVGNSYVGAIVGYANNTTLNNCYSIIDVMGSNANIGGLVGSFYSGTIDSCFAGGVVDSEGSSVGGLSGSTGINAVIIRSFSWGSVEGNSRAGGLVGRHEGTLSYSYSSASVSADYQYLGGLVGNADGCKKLSDMFFNGKLAGLVSGYVGALIGSTDGSKITRCYYNTDLVNVDAYQDCSDNSLFEVSTEDIINESFINSFEDSSQFVYGLEQTQDSYFAPRLAYCDSSNSFVVKHSTDSVRVRLFDYNETSSGEWGSESNPYIIATESQFLLLSELVRKYSYSGYYFILNNDIVLTDGSSSGNFESIGRYYEENNIYNRAFDGVFDGKGYSLRNVKVYINSTNVVFGGIFGYLGKNGVIKNVVIDEQSSVTSIYDNCVATGSVVGFSKGVLDRVVSYAQVSGRQVVGGLVGFGVNGVSVNNSAYLGNMSGGQNMYGLIGNSVGTLADVSFNNSWYLFTYEGSGYLEVGNEGYIHNEYGSVLYVDNNGSVDFIVSFGQTNNNLYSVKVIPDTSYSGFLLNNAEEEVFSSQVGNDIYVLSNNDSITNGYNVNLYARFSKLVDFSFEDISDSNYVSEIKGNKYYYVGQNVSISLRIKYGYFLNVFDDNNQVTAEYSGYKLSNTGEDIIIKFVMPEISELSKKINVKLGNVGDYIDIDDTLVKGTYSGSEREASVSLKDKANVGNKKIFEEPLKNTNFNYYYENSNMPLANNPKNVGNYSVKVSVNVSGSIIEDNNWSIGLVLGYIKRDFTINKATLTLDSMESDWIEAVTKTYDGRDYLLNKDITENVNNIYSSDQNIVSVIADIKWAKSDFGQNMLVTISNFRINNSNNYTIDLSSFADEKIVLNNGVINKKNVVITLESKDLTWVYNDSKPIINKSEGTDAKFLFTKKNDASWTGTTWNVGLYAVTLDVPAESNYDISFPQGATYELEITPYIITKISFTNTDNLYYSGSDLGTSITGEYKIAGSDKIYKANLIYKQNNVVINEIVDVGEYTIVAEINDTNFTLGKEATTTIEILKANNPLALTIDNSWSNTILVGEKGELVIGNALNESDVTYSVVNSVDGSIVKENGKYYFVGLRGNSSYTLQVLESNCKNYNDRLSNELTINIEKSDMYVELAVDTFFYGDIISVKGENPTINLSYYYMDNGVKTYIPNEEIASKDGFVKPNIYIRTDVFDVNLSGYDVDIMGAISDGYNIYEGEKVKLIIKPKELKVLVSSNDSKNTKYYGDDDKDIHYNLLDTNHIQVTNLPNGEKITLSGGLSREVGENVGGYDVSQGTLTTENNANYNIIFEENNILGQYVINRREISLKMPNLTKEYGKSDVDILPELSLDTTLAEGDVLADIVSDICTITREVGEDVGEYNYIISNYDSNGSANYYCQAIYREDSVFKITKGRPVVELNPLFDYSIEYGNKLERIKLNGTATYLDNDIAGYFEWSQPSAVVNQLGETNYSVVFFSNNPNCDDVLFEKSVRVIPKKVSVLFSGSTYYTYNGSNQCKLTASIVGLVGEDKVNLAVDVIEESYKNVGEYTACASIVSGDFSDRYVLKDSTTLLNFFITPKIVTISMENIEIFEGDKINPEITYEGFAKGEDEDDLDSIPTLTSQPTALGYYTLSLSGAEGDNYVFQYKTCRLTIKAKKLTDSNSLVSITGTINPGCSVEVEKVAVDSGKYNIFDKSLRKATESGLLKPYNYSIEESYDFTTTGETGEAEYKLKLSKNYDKNAIIYILGEKEEAKKLKDYEIVKEEDSYYLTFTGADVEGIIIVKDLGVTGLLIGYLPLAGIVLGVVVVAVIVFLSLRLRNKKEKAKEKYYR